MNTGMLDGQADRIEAVLAQFGVMVEVYAGQVLPRVISYHLHLGPGHRVAKLQSLHRELALGLGVPGVLISHQEGRLMVEVPRLGSHPIRFEEVMRQVPMAPPAQTVLLGLSHLGRPLMLYMPSPVVAHVLIAGMTGCGKTELLRSMLASLTTWTRRREVGLYLIDPKNRGLAELATLPGVLDYCRVGRAPHILDQLLTEMEKRDAGGYCLPRLYLVIDELADLMLVEGKVIEVALTRLVQRGREAGIHVIATTQRPSSSVVQGLMKANFPVRITGAVNSALDANIATGIRQSGAERLLGKGDMLLAHQGRLLRFQACLVEEEDLPKGGEHEPGQISRMFKPIGQVMERLRERLSLRSPGRPGKGPTKTMVEFATGRLEANGACSQRELRRWHQKKYGTDVNPPRAAEAIRQAKKNLGLRFA